MGKSERTTAAIRRAIQHSSESIRALASRYGINPKTVAKWRQRSFVGDLKTGPKEAKHSALSPLDEMISLLFRWHLVLPLSDSLAVLRHAAPKLTRSSLHRCWQRHGISIASTSRMTRRDDSGTVGHVTIGSSQIGAALLIVAVESNSKFVQAELYDRVTDQSATEFLRQLIETWPFALRTVTTSDAEVFRVASFENLCSVSGIEHIATQHAYEWNDEQIHHLQRRVREAAEPLKLQRSVARTINRLQQNLSRFVTRYNTRCALKTLKGMTPRAYALQKSATSARTSASRLATKGKGVSERARDRDMTREAILQAARSCLAHDGPEGLSLSEVARIAGVNRGTAYQHFQTREKLIAATAEWVSDKLFAAVFGDSPQAQNAPIEAVDVAAVIDRLATFAMDNPELCRAWLLKVLSSPNPSHDRFWREYEGSTARFAKTALAQSHIDTEVLSIIMLAGAFLWPVWARAHAKHQDDMRPLAYRFAQESLRISMYGNLRNAHFPAIAERLRAHPFTGQAANDERY